MNAFTHEKAEVRDKSSKQAVSSSWAKEGARALLFPCRWYSDLSVKFSLSPDFSGLIASL